MNAKLASATAPQIPRELPDARNPADEFVAIQLRNIEAFTRAQRTMMDGGRTIVEQQLEIITSTATQAMKSAQEIMSEFDLRANLRKRFVVFKASMQDGIGNANSLAEISARSSAQAAQIAHERAVESLDEFQTMLDGAMAAFSPAALVWRR